MSLLRCRVCQEEISSESDACPKCKTRTPFLCAVCNQPTGMVQAIGWAYPFSKDGKALCPNHARRICDKCGQPFERDVLTQRIARWEYIETTREYIQVTGMFCELCNRTHVEPAKPTKAAKRRGCGVGALVMCATGALLAMILIQL